MAERIEERLPPLPKRNAPEQSTDERPSSPTLPGGDQRFAPPRPSPLTPGRGDQIKRRSR
jgi:hypothetical protein